MSKQKHILEIEPPYYYRQQAFEKSVFGGFKCPTCNGMGLLNGINGDSKKKCPDCNGFGKIKAEITITWSPDNNDKQTAIK